MTDGLSLGELGGDVLGSISGLSCLKAAGLSVGGVEPASTVAVASGVLAAVMLSWAGTGLGWLNAAGTGAFSAWMIKACS